MKKTLAVAAALLFSTTIVTPAQAATITYTLSGNFAGALDGNPFQIDAVFTGVGDTDTYDGIFVDLSSLQAVAGGVTYNSVNPAYFFVASGLAGFGTQPNGDFFDFAGLGSYDPTTAIDATPVTFFSGFGQSFVTNNGTAVFSGGSNLTFSAELAGVVPEPATWAMMIGGIGAAGGALRRRRANVSVRYA